MAKNRELLDDLPCPIESALSVFGDRWTLLIVQDLLNGNNKFSQIQKSCGISKHLLSDRLNRLVSEEIVRRVIYDKSRCWFEYELTSKGKGLRPLLCKNYSQSNFTIEMWAGVVR